MAKVASRLKRNARAPSVSARSLAGAILLLAGSASAQFGPLQHGGYLEYQYRLNDGDDIPQFSTNVASWRAQASTWLWRPYILQLNGNLGLTKSKDSSADQTRTSTIVTGGLLADLFPRSRFPFRAYYERHDGRAEGGLVDNDTVRSTWGFLQRYTTRRKSNISLGYEQIDVDDVFLDGTSVNRSTVVGRWQLEAFKSTARNEFRMRSRLRDLERGVELRFEDEVTVSLRHRFRGNERFFIEDTAFFLDERIAINGRHRDRRLLQFNARSDWRPDTERPLRVSARLIGRAVENGTNGTALQSQNYTVFAAASYGLTDRLLLSGDAGVSNAIPDEGSDVSSVFQRIRATYRMDDIDLGEFRYRWTATTEAGNRRQRNHGDDSVQSLAASFDHGLSRSFGLAGGRQLQLSMTQSASAAGDTDEQRRHTLLHSVYATLNRQDGRVSTYLRLSATDRRTFGTREDTFQLLSFQASSRMRVNRKRSLNGGLSVQYNSNSAEMPDGEMRDGRSMSYSVSFSYNERDLFNIRRLDFLSELRLLSSDFMSEDTLDQRMGLDDDRQSNFWRNRLTYRVGRLEMRLNADLRDVDGNRRGQILFLVRRYYGGF